MQADEGTFALILIFIVCLGIIISIIGTRDKDGPETSKYKKKNKKKKRTP